MTSKTKTTATQGESTLALVPKLRFPEFRKAAGWEPLTLQEVSLPVAERVGKRKLTPVSISAGIGFVPQSEKFGRDISGNQYQLYTLVRDGDFVFNKGNSLKFPQGCVYLLRGWGQVAAPNVFICFRLKDGYSNGFFQNCFEQNQHGRQLKRHITSGARSNGLLNISKETFFGVEIPTPSLPEQQKIAECLSSVDELMAAQARKLEALKTHKKGLMQLLFPREGETQPRLRFPEFQNAGEWEESPVEELIVTVTPPKKLQTSDYQPEGQFPIVDQSQDYICGWTNDSEAVIDKGLPVIVFGDHTCALKFIVQPFVQGADGIKILRAKRGIDIRFLFCAFEADPVVQESYKRHFSMLKEKKMSYPDPRSGEQQRIAGCLTTLDELIAAQTQKLEALKTRKKGLMQQLFPCSKEVEA
ncbi:MAG: restriction endonuclease subunit S [Verrucomicrobiota bacterium]